MSGPGVRFHAVSKRFGSTDAVRDVTLEIAGGSFVALVGASGSGKSTLLKLINRLIDPTAGSVAIDGIAECDPALLRRRIGYVFQNIGLFPHMDVAGNIAIGPRLEGRDTDVARLLDLVSLPQSYATRRPAELSGGEQQRVGVARALAGEPGLMLLDEPFGALDPVTRDELCDAYRALHDRLGLTTIMVTHDMAEALLMADRVLVMARGAIVADATPHTLLLGDAGPEAAALVAVPRRQAERLQRIVMA